VELTFKLDLVSVLVPKIVEKQARYNLLRGLVTL